MEWRLPSSCGDWRVATRPGSWTTPCSGAPPGESGRRNPNGSKSHESKYQRPVLGSEGASTASLAVSSRPRPPSWTKDNTDNTSAKGPSSVFSKMFRQLASSLARRSASKEAWPDVVTGPAHQPGRRVLDAWRSWSQTGQKPPKPTKVIRRLRRLRRWGAQKGAEVTAAFQYRSRCHGRSPYPFRNKTLAVVVLCGFLGPPDLE